MAENDLYTCFQCGIPLENLYGLCSDCNILESYELYRFLESDDFYDTLNAINSNDSGVEYLVPDTYPDYGDREDTTGDYVNDAEYEILLQHLAERDLGSHGAPPASKSTVKNLENVVIEKNDEACTICQEIVNVGEVARKLPCKHVYHGECITTWLYSRNSCPVCRFELPTDDEEYENKRKRRKLV